MKSKICKKCGSPMIRFGNNISCLNNECPDYIVKNEDYSYFDVGYYDHIHHSAKFKPEPVGSDFKENYDDFLYFSQCVDYVSRFEYRQMGNFIENELFSGYKINKFKTFVNDDELNLKQVQDKYDLISQGRDLENQDSKEALKFYESLVNNKLFEHDYYIYRKIVKLEKNPEKQFQWIEEFFTSGIYCNRYNYLWFLKKLHQISKKIEITNEDINYLLKKFRKYGFKNRQRQDTPCPLAEKITLNKGILKVRTEKEYALRHFKFELQEEFSNLNDCGKFELSTPILEKLILEYGFKSSKFFKSICTNYLRLDQPDMALKWIYGYFNKSKRFNNPDDWWFINKISELGVKTSYFYHDSLFFDQNEYYLTKDDFKKSEVEFLELSDYISLIKSKKEMVFKGIKLEKSNPNDAIDYYNSILNHELFKNDYYIYMSLAILHDKIGDFESEIDVIISFFKSGIYCDNYVYLFFIYNLKRLSQEFVIYEDEIEDCLKSFKEISFKNKSLQNTPVPLADRIIYKNNRMKIISAEEFDNNQELAALNLLLDLFESCQMVNSVNDILKIMIREYDFSDVDVYKQICYNYQMLNDVESEIEIINYYLQNDKNWNLHDEKWFKERLNVLKNNKNKSKPLTEPCNEILFEKNPYYLTYKDFKKNGSRSDELIDLAISKLKIRYHGWRLEYNDYMGAIDFYNSFLNDELFENDYYIYRRLVVLYQKINNFEMVWETIRKFFASGIYCDRYQYLWFLHKIIDVGRVKYISDEEVTNCLKDFKENGFKNKYSKDSTFLTERIYRYKSSMKLESVTNYCINQIKYEFKEEAIQLELNGFNDLSTKILRRMIDNGCDNSTKIYMRLCHRYREINDLDSELEIINEYLSSNRSISRPWFEKRLKEVNELRN